LRAKRRAEKCSWKFLPVRPPRKFSHQIFLPPIYAPQRALRHVHFNCFFQSPGGGPLSQIIARQGGSEAAATAVFPLVPLDEAAIAGTAPVAISIHACCGELVGWLTQAAGSFIWLTLAQQISITSA